ncbi:MAG: 16S rRNA (adenine(1518)-N(6)/adenine(1519)-N(6))-dimethyltransferase RsmA [Acidaminococcaceae bacterium]|nr:16S rRNA (adenine(1518)-N(6)/adenine(1519)-N(6))-dimethyltransferase RsmA [Acidaminococcaceae bacterium]
MESIQPIIARREVTTRILQAFHLKADKNLGQNFLVEESVVNRIAKVAELTSEDTVLEIGPGIGTLTQALALTGANVVSVELDKRLLPVLQETVGAYENVRIVQGDILKVNIPEIIAEVKAGKRGTEGTAVTAVTPEGDAKAERGATDPSLSFKVCANLPYYITTPIIMNLLEQKLPLERLVVMVQKEVAERMTATPGGREYGAISVAMQYYTEPKIAFIVKAGSFLPAPKVDSAVLVCKRRTVPPVDVPDEKIFFKVVAAAFSVRRKMLTNSLKNMGGLTGDQVKSWLDRAGIDGKRRAETLSLEEFAMLARAWKA